MSRDDFWRIRATPTFLDFIVDDGLLKSMTTSATAGPSEDGSCTRELAYVPAKVDCPGIVRGVVGDTAFAVRDEQCWNDVLEERRYRQSFKIRPSFLTALSRTFGELRIEAVDIGENEGSDGSDGSDRCSETESGSGSEGAKEEEEEEAEEEGEGKVWTRLPSSERCMHVVEGETRVSIMTVGWFVERSIAHNLRLFYREYPKTVGRFRTFLVDKYGGGDGEVPMALVVDRFLEEEAEKIANMKAADEDLEEGEDGESIVGSKDDTIGDSGSEGDSVKEESQVFETLTPQASFETRLDEMS